MAVSKRYYGKGLGGSPTFNGKHNKAKFLTLLILANIDLHNRHFYPKGVPVPELARISGVKVSTLYRNLPRWDGFGLVNRVQRPSGFWTKQCYRVGFGSAQCFYYSIGARGKRWLSEYQHLVPLEWYAHL